jgi:hypothetical protein
MSPIVDVNRDGSVDPVDVQALETRIEAGTAGPEFDYNNDGVVDQQDVSALFDAQTDHDTSGASESSMASLALLVVLAGAAAYGVSR